MFTENTSDPVIGAMIFLSMIAAGISLRPSSFRDFVDLMLS